VITLSFVNRRRGRPPRQEVNGIKITPVKDTTKIPKCFALIVHVNDCIHCVLSERCLYEAHRAGIEDFKANDPETYKATRMKFMNHDVYHDFFDDSSLNKNDQKS
jgi:hypothetical protein